MSKYEMANEKVGLGKTEGLGSNNLVSDLNILLNNGGAEFDKNVMIIVEKRVIEYAQDLENNKTNANKGKDMQTLKGSNQEYTKEQVIEAMNMLSDICHSASVRGGWWHDLTTGEPLERNKLEMLCLVHSEVSEACEGVRKGINDDHLPQYRMEDVEMADTFVRCFDYVEGHGLKTAEAFVDKLIYNANRADHKPENRVKEGGKKY